MPGSCQVWNSIWSNSGVSRPHHDSAAEQGTAELSHLGLYLNGASLCWAGCSSSNSLFFCAFKGELHWGIDETAAQLERVLSLYKSGEYLQNTTRMPKAGKEVFLETLNQRRCLILSFERENVQKPGLRDPWNPARDSLSSAFCFLGASWSPSR